MKIRPLLIAALLAALAALSPLSAFAAQNAPAGSPDKSAWPSHLRLLTGPNGGQWFMLGEPISQVLTRRVLPTSSRIGGGVSNIDALNKKLGDLGFTLTCFMGAAGSGEPEYASIQLENTVVMANVYPQVLYFLIREDFAEKHGITDVATLLSQKIPLRFATLRPGTASEFILTLLLKHGYNTNYDKLKAQGWTVNFNNYAETADNFVAGDLDCFASTAGTEVPLILTMEKHTGVKVLPVDQRVLDLLSEKFKTGTYIIPSGVYKSVTEPVRTLGDYTTLVVRKDFPEDLVFEICQALWGGKTAITKVVADFGAFSPETALPKNLDVHPGALRFWSGLKK